MFPHPAQGERAAGVTIGAEGTAACVHSARAESTERKITQLNGIMHVQVRRTNHTSVPRLDKTGTRRSPDGYGTRCIHYSAYN